MALATGLPRELEARWISLRRLRLPTPRVAIGPPVQWWTSHPFLFWTRGKPPKIDYRKRKVPTYILTALVED